MTTTAVVWEGADSLKEYLVPVDELTPWDKNPRLGDVMSICGSLKRFGQVRAIAVREDGKSVVAGHHLRLAAIELGWTHVAAIPINFTSEEEGDIYAIADNELAMLGGYDDQKMFELMEQYQLFDPANLVGTGLTLDRTEDIMAAAGQTPEMSTQAGERGYSEDAQAAAERASQLAAGKAMRETVLMLTPEERDTFDVNVKLLSKFFDLTSVIQVVLRSISEMAKIAASTEEAADTVAGDDLQDADIVQIASQRAAEGKPEAEPSTAA